jgi:hypothetical protein
VLDRADGPDTAAPRFELCGQRDEIAHARTVPAGSDM